MAKVEWSGSPNADETSGDGDGSEDSSKEYEVGGIEDKRWSSLYGEPEYLVKWVGYAEMTWTRESNMVGCGDLMTEFNAKYKDKGTKKKRRHKKESSKSDIGDPQCSSTTNQSEGKRKEKKSKVRVRKVIIDSDEEEPLPQCSSSPSQSNATTTGQMQNREEQAKSSEEEDEPGPVLDLTAISSKIIPDGSETGFDRGWEVDRILAVRAVSEPDGVAKKKVAIVKFHRFKYAQQIPLPIVYENAREQLFSYMNEELFKKAAREKLFA